MNNVICLEGLPGSGKTSLLKLLNEQKIKIVEELLIPFSGPIDQEYVIRNDRAKFEKAKELSKDSTVFVDRGYASTVAHDFALKVDNPRKIINSVNALARAVRSELLPEKIIYIDISCETSIKRKNRPFSDDIWTQLKYLEEIKHYYDFLMPQQFHLTEIVRLDGNLSLDELYKLTLTSIQNEE